MNRYILIGVVLLVLVIAGFQMVQLNSLKNTISGAATVSGGGETYEQMMARMHPDQVQPKTSGNLPSMVGGC